MTEEEIYFKMQKFMMAKGIKIMMLHVLDKYFKEKDYNLSGMDCEMVGDIVSSIRYEDMEKDSDKEKRFYELMNNSFDNKIDVKYCVERYEDRRELFRSIMGYDMPTFDTLSRLSNRCMRPVEPIMRVHSEIETYDVDPQRIIEENNKLRYELNRSLQRLSKKEEG